MLRRHNPTAVLEDLHQRSQDAPSRWNSTYQRSLAVAEGLSKFQDEEVTETCCQAYLRPTQSETIPVLAQILGLALC